MPPLYCSVCKDQYFGRNDWLHHLTQEGHQKLARKGFLTEEAKLEQSGRSKNCLVVFTLIPLTSDPTASLEVLEYFSKLVGGDEGEALITDFVWWTDRPYLGVLQFESMAKVEEVLKALEVREGSSSLPKIRIGRRHHQTIHVKAGYQMPMLEWRGILPPIKSPPNHQTSFNDNPVTIKEEPQEPDADTSDAESIKEVPQEPDADTSDAESIKEVPQEPDTDTSDAETIDNYRDFKRVKLLIKKEPQDNHLDNKNYAKPSASSRHPVSSSSLQFEYQAIQKIMLIPDSQNLQISAAMTSLKTIVSNLDPFLQAAPFRKGCLKLNYPRDQDNQEDLLCHVYSLGEHTAFEVDAKVKDYLNQNETQFKLVRECKDQLIMKHLPTNLKITLVTPKRKGCLAEVQVCRLMEYLCKFDPRCNSLMTLVCYWVTLNKINVAGEGEIFKREDQKRALPSQYTVQWLVLFFLSNKFYIPTVREIQDMNPVDYLRDEVTGENIGFLSDPGDVEKWRKLEIGSKRSKDRRIRGGDGNGTSVGGGEGEEHSDKFILSVLLLLQRFLGTMGKFLRKKHPWIFNTVDGVQIAVSRFVGMERRRWGTKGSRWEKVREEEAGRLKRALGEDEMRRRMEGGEIWMTHPFLWGERIGLVDGDGLGRVVEDFLEGGRKLGRFLEGVDGDGGVEMALGREGGLENLLRI